MVQNRQINAKIYSRAVVAIMLLTSWSITALSGFILWLAPTGPRAGRVHLFLGFTKGEWSDIHFWIAVAAIVITLVHVILDWRVLSGVIRYLVSVHRRPDLFSE